MGQFLRARAHGQDGAGAECLGSLASRLTAARARRPRFCRAGWRWGRRRRWWNGARGGGGVCGGAGAARGQREWDGHGVMVAQFAVELQGLRASDGKDPPRILHLNPRLQGGWSRWPVLVMNTASACSGARRSAATVPPPRTTTVIGWVLLTLISSN